MGSANDIISHSVTKEDYDTASQVVTFRLFNTTGTETIMPPNPPPYWSVNRDAILRRTKYYETAWANAIYIAVTKMAALSWRIRGPKSSARSLRDMMISADGKRGWVTFISKHLQDYLLTDNGAFVEIVRASGADGSKIIGLVHLDSLRCIRTNDPSRPVIYRDRHMKWHTLKDYQVMMFCDMPSSDEMWNGIGWCAGSRAYSDYYNKYAMETYLKEKTTGQRPLAIHFVNNASIGQIETAVTSAEAGRRAKGYVQYMGAVIVPNLDPTVAPQVATIDLAGLPDGFLPKEERMKANLAYANAIGLDPQDLDPQLLASQAQGTGAQARVIDDKASAKGLIAWRQDFSYQINENVAAATTTWYFMEKDYRDQLQELAVEQARTTIMVDRISAGIFLPEMALQMLVDAEDVPPEFLAYDITPNEDISGDQKPPSDLVSRDNAPTPNDPSSEAGMATRDTYTVSDTSAKEMVEYEPGIAGEYAIKVKELVVAASTNKMNEMDMIRNHKALIAQYTTAAYQLGKTKASKKEVLEPLKEKDKVLVEKWIDAQCREVPVFAKAALGLKEIKHPHRLKAFHNNVLPTLLNFQTTIDAVEQLGFAAEKITA